jgi:hypothetical protein
MTEHDWATNGDLVWSDADQGYIPYADYEAEIRPEEMDEALANDDSAEI